MVLPYYSEHRWSRVGAVYASDICQFRDTLGLEDIEVSLYQRVGVAGFQI